MSAVDVTAVVVVVALTAMAAVLAAAETALTHMRRARVETLVDEERKGAAELHQLVAERDQTLSPVLFLALVCHLTAAAVVGAMVDRHFGVEWVIAAVPAMIILIFVLAEALPKTWALRSTDSVALRVAPLVRRLVRFPPLRWVSRSLVWLTRLLLPKRVRSGGPVVTEEELLAFADVALEVEAIDEEEHQLIESVIAFGDTVVREVMKPRPDIVGVEADFRVADAMEVAVLNGFSRVPVTGEALDDIIGVVHAKDLMRAHLDGRGDQLVTSCMRPAVYVPETKKADDLVREMQAARYHMAIVVDEYGGTAGLVTLEDLIEEVFGEIVDEFDREEPLLFAAPGGQVRVHGRMPLDELSELLKTELPDGDWDTVGGLIFNALGRVPRCGEYTDVGGWRFGIERLDGRRITQVRIMGRTPEPAP